MPKYRQLHTKIIDSFDFNEMPDDFTRVVWLLLTLILDSEGRGIDNPTWVKSKMFPMRPDISEQQIIDSFDWLDQRKMIVRYKFDNHFYFYIPTFKLYQTGTQKESASILPDPELVRSSSREAPDELRAAESESASASASKSVNEFDSSLNTREEIKTPSPATAKNPPSSGYVVDVLNQVAGMWSVPGSESDKVYPAMDGLYYQHGQDQNKLIEFLKPYYEAWIKRKGKNGKPYSKSNLTWLYDWAVAGEIPGQGNDNTKGNDPPPNKKQGMDFSEIDEFIEELKARGK